MIDEYSYVVRYIIYKVDRLLEWVTVGEADIARAVLDCFECNRLLVEPAGAVALAAARIHEPRAGHPAMAGRPVVAIVSGGNTTADFIQTLQAASP